MTLQRRLKKFFLTNWPAKLIILLAVAGLWIFVASTESTVGNFPGKIEIKTINAPNGYAAIYDQREVSLKIMAEPPVWRVLSERSFSSYVDLSNLEEGTYELPVNVTCSVKDVQIVERDPASIMVRIERNISKTVPIASRVEGIAAPGMIAGEVAFDIKEATISGPESVVNKVTEATAVVRLNNESSDFSKTVNLTAYNDNNEEITTILIHPESVTAKVAIVKASNNKTVAVKVRTSGAPKDGYYISEITSEPQTVDIVGPEANLRAISFVETVEVNVADLDKNLSRTVSLRVPSGVALQSDAVTAVKINITIAESDISRQISAKIVPVNLDPSLSILGYSPYEVKVLVSGASSALSGLTADDVVLNLDLAEKSSGRQTIALANNMFSLKQGLSILSIMPSSLVVILEN